RLRERLAHERVRRAREPLGEGWHLENPLAAALDRRGDQPRDAVGVLELPALAGEGPGPPHDRPQPLRLAAQGVGARREAQPSHHSREAGVLAIVARLLLVEALGAVVLVAALALHAGVGVAPRARAQLRELLLREQR